MSAPQSPITSLLTWLTVSVFLLAGAPAPRQPAGLKDGQHRATAANELAKSFASLDLAQPQSAAPLPLLKVWDLADAPATKLFTAPLFLQQGLNKFACAAPAIARRPSLVGTIELRI